MEKDINLTENNINETELLSQNTKIAQDFLEKMLEKMEIDAKISLEEKPSAVILQIESEDAKFLIGPHGETMHAIQTTLNSLLQKGSKLSKKVLVDVDHYREKQEQALRDKTQKAIEKCLKSATPVSLDFMNAYERHVVHELVLEDGRVVSESFGKEPRRFVKIFIK